MRKISVLLSAFIIALSTISYAEPQATVSGNLDKTMTINGQNYHVVRTIDNNNVSIKVLDKDSKEIWTSIALGFDAWNFKLNGKSAALKSKMLMEIIFLK